MSKIQRITNLVLGLIVLVTGISMTVYTDDAYAFVIFFLSMGFLLSGIERLVYYFTMAKYMVGGKESLYRGIIFLDFALFTLSISDVPSIYILMYLALIHAFSGAVDILRAVEAKSYSSKHWKLKLFHGILNVAVSAGCFIFINNPGVAVLVYGIGLVYSGILRIISAFRKTTFVYIR